MTNITKIPKILPVQKIYKLDRFGKWQSWWESLPKMWFCQSLGWHKRENLLRMWLKSVKIRLVLFKSSISCETHIKSAKYVMICGSPRSSWKNISRVERKKSMCTWNSEKFETWGLNTWRFCSSLSLVETAGLVNSSKIVFHSTVNWGRLITLSMCKWFKNNYDKRCNIDSWWGDWR